MGLQLSTTPSESVHCGAKLHSAFAERVEMSLPVCPSSCSCEEEYILKCLECPPREYTHYGLPEHVVCKLIGAVTSRLVDPTSRTDTSNRVEALQIASLVLTAIGLVLGVVFVVVRW